MRKARTNMSSLAAVAAILAMLFFLSPAARADLILDGTVDLSGTGIGNVALLVAVHDPGGVNAVPQNLESGCIGLDSSGADLKGSGSCLGGLFGDDEITGNGQTWSLAELGLNDASEVVLVVDVAEDGNPKEITLTDLYFAVYDPNAADPSVPLFSAFYTGPDLVLDQDEGTGVGISGFAFPLDDPQALLASAFTDPNYRIGGGVQFGEGTSGDGNDTLFIIRGEGGGTTEIPEPATLVLLGTGLLGMAARRRRNSKP